MKYGLVYHTGFFGIAPEQVTGLARHAEQCGFESFFTTEHIALYPGVTLGRMPIAPDTPIADPLEVLSFVAGVTERIILGTSVLLLPFHQPVVLAKRLATIDQLSRGRMRLFGIGVGSLAKEAEAAGVDFHTRGRRADEQRSAQVVLMRETARAAGRDADALEYTRWGNIAMTPDDVAPLAADGVTRLIVSPTTADLAGQRDELSAFAERHGLG